jgi:hypothetical protein
MAGKSSFAAVRVDDGMNASTCDWPSPSAINAVRLPVQSVKSPNFVNDLELAPFQRKVPNSKSRGNISICRNAGEK